MGFIGGIKNTLKKGAKAIKEWDEKAPERRKAEIKKLQQEKSILLERKKTIKLKNEIRDLRKSTSPSFGSLDGFDPFDPIGSMQHQKKKQVGKKKKKKEGSKSKPRKRVIEFY